MKSLIKTPITNYIQPKLLQDPGLWQWLIERQATLSGEDIKEINGAIAELFALGVKTQESMQISHTASFPSRAVAESLASWLDEKGYFGIDINRAPREEESWWIWFYSDAPDLIVELFKSVKAVHEKIDDLGGTYDEWAFSTPFSVSHRPTLK
jgi:hypothetical protein